MVKNLFSKALQNSHDEIMEKYLSLVDRINDLEQEFSELSDDELAAKTQEFRKRIVIDGETLDDLLPEAFATVREASKRTIGQRHYDVQLMGGIAEHERTIAEVRTGEGKTLMATLPIYLNALDVNPDWIKAAEKMFGGKSKDEWEYQNIIAGKTVIPIGKGVHLVTVNDYLARRDARWMSPIFKFLRMNTGVLQSNSKTEHGKYSYIVTPFAYSPDEFNNGLTLVPREITYQEDITYGSKNEFGHDYLRDNMKMSLGERVQRGHHFAIIDEVDNVLIDDARTPLIISGPKPGSVDMFQTIDTVVKQLKSTHFDIEEKNRSLSLTIKGEQKMNQLLQDIGITDEPLFKQNGDSLDLVELTIPEVVLNGYIQQCLNANFIYKKGKDYEVEGDKVIIVDHFTGRLMPGRRWSDGLHQAVEAKEEVPVEPESTTYATITIQNYFRMYEKLAGMTGTAIEDSEEFGDIYKLDTIEIPTHVDYLASLPESGLELVRTKDMEGFDIEYWSHTDDPDQKPIFHRRQDRPDTIYKTPEGKVRVISSEILRSYVHGRPVLTGTTSVEKSEIISDRLGKESIQKLSTWLLLRNHYLQQRSRKQDGKRIKELKEFDEESDGTAIPLNNLDMSRLEEKALELGYDQPIVDYVDTILDALNVFDFGQREQSRERLIYALENGVPHNVLNARHEAQEAQIIAGAGAFGAVTIATNMAGRGVDIKLGGALPDEIIIKVNDYLSRNGYEEPTVLSLDEKIDGIGILAEENIDMDQDILSFIEYSKERQMVMELGGLDVIGSERNEARRIDNQLRGRAARQGEPGRTRFCISYEDELLLRFGSGAPVKLLNHLVDIDPYFPVDHKLISKFIEGAQSRVEGANFDVRKHLLAYDDVLNKQRKTIYGFRDKVLAELYLTDIMFKHFKEEVYFRAAMELEVDETVEELAAEINAQGVIVDKNADELEIDENARELFLSLNRLQPSMQIGEHMVDSFFNTLLTKEMQYQDPNQISDEAWKIVEKYLTKTKPKKIAEEFSKHARLNFELIAQQIGYELMGKFSKIQPKVRIGILPHPELYQLAKETAEIGENPEKQKEFLEKRQSIEQKLFGEMQVTDIFRKGIVRDAGHLWMDYLSYAEAERVRVGLHAYGQRDPLVVYKTRSHAEFENVVGEIRNRIAENLFKVAHNKYTQACQPMQFRVPGQITRPKP